MSFLARRRESRERVDESPLPPALPVRAIVIGGALVLASAVAAVTLLLRFFGTGQNQLDVIRTAGTIIVGTGGAAALLLAARRQRWTELTLKHQEKVAAETQLDALERRITELYTKAADQLGSDQAPVRLAGLYALERLAHDNPGQREMIGNVLCAYLRMHTRSAEAPEERQVRLAAQRILHRHRYELRPSLFWDGLTIDLSGADLSKANFEHMDLFNADFSGADLSDANLGWASLDNAGLSDADLTGAKLESASLNHADVLRSDLIGADLRDANLGRADLTGSDLSLADLSGADLTNAGFRDADLSGANLAGADLTGSDLTGAELRGARWGHRTCWGENLIESIDAASDPDADGYVIVREPVLEAFRT
ncbi:pentapeptide repeat-containing protein [Amycolatopsis japonica]|uniref:pentapeptide repeat-containing protein n=1 Tax=Amycolatopsis japonica TaxID=208439 RepID=UPI00381423BA